MLILTARLRPVRLFPDIWLNIDFGLKTGPNVVALLGVGRDRSPRGWNCLLLLLVAIAFGRLARGRAVRTGPDRRLVGRRLVALDAGRLVTRDRLVDRARLRVDVLVVPLVPLMPFAPLLALPSLGRVMVTGAPGCVSNSPLIGTRPPPPLLRDVLKG